MLSPARNTNSLYSKGIGNAPFVISATPRPSKKASSTPYISLCVRPCVKSRREQCRLPGIRSIMHCTRQTKASTNAGKVAKVINAVTRLFSRLLDRIAEWSKEVKRRRHRATTKNYYHYVWQVGETFPRQAVQGPKILDGQGPSLSPRIRAELSMESAKKKRKRGQRRAFRLGNKCSGLISNKLWRDIPPAWRRL